jgi:predicted DNA-binding protein (UPF0251 family)
LNEDGVANVDERFWQELADTHAAFYNHNNAVDLSKLTFIRIISTARKNISQNLKVGEVLQQNSLKAVNK